MSRRPFDVAVIGAGPAGCVAARLLAGWGHSAALVHLPRGRPVNIAESLPPSVATALQLAGVREAVEGAGFVRSVGNMVWWGDGEPRVEEYQAPRWGYHVERLAFDGLLRDLAAAAGVQVCQAAPSARYLLDCSGRTGVLARKGLRIATGLRTMGLGAVWKTARVVHPGHTMIETYRDGWAWSVPMSDGRRYVAVMIDAVDTERTHGQGVAVMYRDEIAKTVAFRECLQDAGMVSACVGCDASTYHALRYVDGNTLLVGDAASAIDPLSSFGVKKALTSAWLAAVAVHTALIDPSRAGIAFSYFQRREQQAFADACRGTARHYREIAAAQPHPFWTRRAATPAEPEFYDPEELVSELQKLRDAGSIHLRCCDSVRRMERPVVEGNEIVMREGLSVPQLPDGMEYVGGVQLSALIELAEQCEQVPALHEAYNRRNETVDLPNLLGALCLLLAKGALIRMKKD